MRPPLIGVALAGLLLMIAILRATAAEPSVDTLYRNGIAAKAAGDLDAAARDFERALALQPDDVDVMVQLGLVYGAEQRYGEARTVLERAGRLAPGDLDVETARAHVEAYAGNFAAAEAAVEAVLARQPQNVDALTLAGRLAYYRKDYQAARRSFEAALATAPDDPDALLGLGDTLRGEGDEGAAEAAYRKAGAAAPGSREIAERLAHRPPVPKRWRLDAAFSYSRLSRVPTPDWKETFDQLGYVFDNGDIVHGRVEASERFGQYDAYLEGGLDHRFDDRLSGYASVGGTPAAHFREHIAGLGGGGYKALDGGDLLNATVLTFDGKVADYSTGDVETVKPGIQQYFFKGRFWATAQSITTRDENGHPQQGWLLRGDVIPVERLIVFVGLAEAPETSDNVTARTRSQFAGGALEITDDLVLRLDYLREDRARSYLRQAVTLGVAVRF